MNELITTTQNEQGDIILSGRELHEFLEVKTPYTQWFDRMKGYGFEENIDYILVSQKSETNNPKNPFTTMQDHHIKLDMAKEIAMIQRSDKGKEARQYFLKVEKMWNSPEMIIKRAMDLQQKKILELETKIQSDLPYTSFGKIVSNSTGAISIGAFAKILYDKHGIKIGRNKLFEWLRDQGYLIKSGRERNNPKQIYIEQGLFEVKPTIVSRTDGDIEKLTTLITGKGQIKLAEILSNGFGVAI